MSKIANFRVQFQQQGGKKTTSTSRAKRSSKRTGVAASASTGRDQRHLSHQEKRPTISKDHVAADPVPSPSGNQNQRRGARVAAGDRSGQQAQASAAPGPPLKSISRASNNTLIPSNSVVDDFMLSTLGRRGAKVPQATEKSGLFFHGRASSIFTNAATTKETRKRPALDDQPPAPTKSLATSNDSQKKKKRRRPDDNDNDQKAAAAAAKPTSKKTRPLPNPSELLFAMEQRLDQVVRKNVKLPRHVNGSRSQHSTAFDRDIRTLQQETLILFTENQNTKTQQTAVLRNYQRSLNLLKTHCKNFDRWLNRVLSSALVGAELDAAVIETNPARTELQHQSVPLLNRFLSVRSQPRSARTYKRRK